jgi:hypothetical protein
LRIPVLSQLNFAFRHSWKAQMLAWAGVLVIGGIGAWFSLDRERRALARMDYWLDQREYARVLDAARQARRLDYPAEERLHLALYHCGLLGESLFTYTNQTRWQFFAGMTLGLEGCRAQIQPLLELGQLNEAEHMAHEACEWNGDRPDILLALARINVLKDRPVAARVYLNVLRKMPFRSAGAREALSRLEQKPGLLLDRDLAGCATNRVRSDLAYNKMPSELLIRQALHSNPRNSMALEYMMADCLLSGSLDKLPEKYAQWASAREGSTIPRHGPQRPVDTAWDARAI